MKNKKTSRPAATGNGSRFTHLRIIIASQTFRNKLHVALMHGTVAGAVLAIITGILFMETSILEGLIISGVGIAWLGVFYILHSDDEWFRGWRE